MPQTLQSRCQVVTQACTIIALLTAGGSDRPSSMWGSVTLVVREHVGLILRPLLAFKFKPAVDSQPSLASPLHLEAGGACELTVHLGDSGHQCELTDSFTHLLT